MERLVAARGARQRSDSSIQETVANVSGGVPAARAVSSAAFLADSTGSLHGSDQSRSQVGVALQTWLSRHLSQYMKYRTTWPAFASAEMTPGPLGSSGRLLDSRARPPPCVQGRFTFVRFRQSQRAVRTFGDRPKNTNRAAPAASASVQ